MPSSRWSTSRSATCAARIKQGIQPLRALTFLRQMAEALKVLHDAGVLHRDLKPGNVMLRDESSVALIDYGLSKHVELDATLTNNGEIFGTPYYMSPEQGHGRDTDARSDIYSIGIIFYELLMRRKPYVAGTPMQVIYKHAHSPLPELKAELKRFEEILYNCIAKDPKRRYASADQLARRRARTRTRRDRTLAAVVVRMPGRAGFPRSLRGTVTRSLGPPARRQGAAPATASRGAGDELPAGVVPAHDVRLVVPGAEDDARALAAVDRSRCTPGRCVWPWIMRSTPAPRKTRLDRARVDVGDVAGRIREVLAAAVAGLGRESAPRLDRQPREARPQRRIAHQRAQPLVRTVVDAEAVAVADRDPLVPRRSGSPGHRAGSRRRPGRTARPA